MTGLSGNEQLVVNPILENGELAPLPLVTTTQAIANLFGGGSGPAGGNASLLIFDTLAAFTAALGTIPGSIDYVLVAARNGISPLIGATIVSLAYKRASVSSGLYGELSSGGTYWVPQYSTSPINCCEFGAIGNAISTGTPGVMTGTDSTAFIRAALDFAMQNNFNDIKLPEGSYITSDTLQVGYGGAYQGLNFKGGSRASYNELAGTTIYASMKDRPAVNLQGLRYGGLHGMEIIGPGQTYIANNITGCPPADPNTWLDPALAVTGNNPGAFQPTAPLAGVAIDAYSGSVPTIAYPAVTYPAWTGISSQYGKNTSSAVTINEVRVSGYPVGIVCQPNSNANGDFVRITGGSFGYCIYAIAICQTNSRNVEIRDVNFDLCWNCIDGGTFGAQHAELNGPIDNISVDQCYSIFNNIYLNYSGPLRISNAYFENTCIIGYFTADSNKYPVIFEGCQFKNGETQYGYIPAEYIQASYLTDAPAFIFDGCAFANSYSMMNLSSHAKITLRNCKLLNITGWQGTLTAAQQQALAYTGGMVFSRLSEGNLYERFRAEGFNQMLVPGGMQFFSDELHTAQTRMLVDQYARRFVDANGREWRIAKPWRDTGFSFTSTSAIPVAPVWTNDSVTFTVNSTWSGWTGPTPAVGHLIVHQNTGTLFLVTAVGTLSGNNYTVTCLQLNNKTLNPNSSYAFVSNQLNDFTLAGQSYLIDTTPFYLNSPVLWGSFTSGSKNVTNVQDGTGNGSYVSTAFLVNDNLQGLNYNDTGAPWPVAPGSTITAVTNGSGSSGGSLTLSQNALATGRFPVCGLPIF